MAGAFTKTQRRKGQVKFFRNQQIEELAEARLAELERLVGKPLTPPIPIDLLAERILELNFLWDQIDELPGEMILGALIPKKRLVVLNEKRRGLFQQKPGLERSTKGHEMGHWDLFVDKATLDHPALFGVDEQGPFAFRSCPAGEVTVLKILQSSPEGQELLRKMNSRADESSEARAVNRYAAAISMPKALLREEALKIDRTKWPNLYRLAEQFGVNISALRVRLEQLDLLRIGSNNVLYESRDKAVGQGALNL
jgi:hypothetical protein